MLYIHLALSKTWFFCGKRTASDLSSILFIKSKLHCRRFMPLCNSRNLNPIYYQTGALSSILFFKVFRLELFQNTLLENCFLRDGLHIDFRTQCIIIRLAVVVVVVWGRGGVITKYVLKMIKVIEFQSL